MGPVVLAIALLYAGLAAVFGLTLLRSARPPAPRRRHWPSVDVVVPARDEAARMPALIASLAAQDYPGPLRVYLVDDRSSDGTGALARRLSAGDPRFSVLRIDAPSRRMAPKVHAVAHGIAAGSGAWIVTSDADCVHPSGWLQALIGAAAASDVLVSGYVETARPGEANGLLRSFEAIDWASLMIVNRALMRLGQSVASSANNQAYRRDAFERAGGFGVAGRAPSGDEDLLAQRLGALPGATVRFVDSPAARVLTEPVRSWPALLRQRRRWVSRYHHPQQYRPAFLAGIVLLGVHSVTLSLGTAALPWWEAGRPWLLAAWLAVLAPVLSGMRLGLGLLGRRDLRGLRLVAWALLHPPFIALVSVSSFVKPASWRAGADGYRRRWWRARLRRLRPRRGGQW
jgi:cellulose synthase/poly-beta-1,6-N-acetylglucosamine synthase-like glycosyltransferase